MSKMIAYLGDDSRPGPASYLCGIMTHYDLSFTHIPSSLAAPTGIFGDGIGLYILSDYPSAQWGKEAMARLCERVRAGAGLLMLGGWESYHGLGGDYDRTPLAELLPVEISSSDDRRNESQLVLVRRVDTHPIVDALPFDRPPGIGGYNAFTPRPEAKVLLEGAIHRITCPDGGQAEFSERSRFPLLVVNEGAAGPGGAGRRACLATDVAPHWIGGFVDWGDTRVTVHMGGDFIEVGAWYAAFFRNLLAWCLGEDQALSAQ